MRDQCTSLNSCSGAHRNPLANTVRTKVGRDAARTVAGNLRFGSEAEISGNGTRCVAAYLCADSIRERVTVRTGAGIKTCALISHDGMLFEFETAMGKPQVSEEFSIKTAFGEVRGTPVSMGNPHFSVFVNGFPTEWQSQGAAIGMYRDFQHGMNVELVKVLDSANIEV